MSIAAGQHASAGGTSPTTGAVTTQVSGSTFIIYVGTATGNTIGTPTDSKSNTYTPLGSEQAVGALNICRVFVKENGTGGSGHTASSGAGAFTSIIFLEITGAATASYDSGSLAQADDTTSPYQVTSGTLAQAAELLIAAICSDSIVGGSTFSESTGFTIQEQDAAGDVGANMALATKVVASTSAVTPSFTNLSGGITDTKLTIFGLKEAVATDILFAQSIF